MRSVARIGGKCEAGGMLIVEGTRLVHGERSADFMRSLDELWKLLPRSANRKIE